MRTVLIAALPWLSGCLLLPIPHYQNHLPECSGRVVDAQSGIPITNAVVTVKTRRYEGSAVSDGAGRFRIAATGGWHLIFWIATPSAGSLLPTHLHPQDEWVTKVAVRVEGEEVAVRVEGEYRDPIWDDFVPLMGGRNMDLKIDRNAPVSPSGNVGNMEKCRKTMEDDR